MLPGQLVAGLQEGDGTAYYPSGQRAYAGAFAEGLYEGEGTEYWESGQVRYRGSFAQGLYDGSGALYLEDGDQIRGEFSAGAAEGTIQWYQDGKLWYEGGLTDWAADGFGTLYAESGDAVYAGEFDRGTLDGAWLLELTAGELRTAFGEAKLTETDRGDGFLIENQELGLTALWQLSAGGDRAPGVPPVAGARGELPPRKAHPLGEPGGGGPVGRPGPGPRPRSCGSSARGGLSGGRNGWGRLVPEPVPL